MKLLLVVVMEVWMGHWYTYISGSVEVCAHARWGTIRLGDYVHRLRRIENIWLAWV
jgi:hypothetical protein